MQAFLSLALAAAHSYYVLAGTVIEVGSCIIANDRIDPSSHKFVSDCDDQTYCSNGSTVSPQSAPTNASVANAQSSGTCTKRKCRKDEFPFGYAANEVLPPLCSHGTACPDNGSGCQPLLEAGSNCDMERDYQCASSQNGLLLASPLNFNGSICLQSKCL